MKKNLFYYLFAVMCTVALFTACSDDDGPGDDGGDIKKVLMENAIGTYSGDLTVTLEGLPSFDPITQKIFVEQESADKVKLSLRNFSITVAGAPVPVGDIEIGGIVLEGDANNVVLQSTSTTMQHKELGQLDITLSSGNVVNGKASLKIDVVQVALELNILVNFEGNRISTEVDKTDYAKELAGWYDQTELTPTGAPDGFEMAFPNTIGIELVYTEYNKISVKRFPISFPPRVQYIELEDLSVEKAEDGNVTIAEAKKTIADDQNKGKEIELVFSGNVKDGIARFNISMKSEQYNISYVYVGKKTLTGNKIETFTIEGDVVKVQPEMNDAEIVFFVSKGTTAEQLKALVPVFTISEGAILKLNDVEYVAGTPVDFSKEQSFAVTSQKGTTKVYTVNYKEWAQSFETNLDEWEVQNPKDKDNLQYSAPIGGWSSSNGGVYYIKSMFESMYSKDAPYAVVETQNAKSGSAACLKTLDTKGAFMWITAIPKVTSGSLFNGDFVVDLANTLKSTHFGNPCDKEPKSFSGSYKYTPGKTYYRATTPGDPMKAHEVVEDNSIKDTPAMNAVLYEVDTYAFDYLDGTNLLTSNKVVAVASVEYSEAAEAGYIDFNVSFKYKDNKSFESTKKYKLAIVCSSSKDGDKFSGAPGSELLVDDLKIVF